MSELLESLLLWPLRGEACRDKTLADSWTKIIGPHNKEISENFLFDPYPREKPAMAITRCPSFKKKKTV